MPVAPDRPIFLSAEWRYLLMLNWAVDPAILEPYVPKGTRLGFHEGRCYVSVVGFLFQKTKVLGLPIPGHRHFPEVNLRFYVMRDTDTETRRGVVFIRELVPRRMVAFMANSVYNERYRAMPMRHVIDLQAGRVAYEWFYRDRWQGVGASFNGEPTQLLEGTHDEFIAQQLWGYTTRKDGRTNEFQVSHPIWRAWNVSEPKVDIDVEQLYGREFTAPLSGAPHSAFLAEGSPITVHRYSILN